MGGGGDGNRSNWTMHYISCYWCRYFMLITFFLVILSFPFGLNVERIFIRGSLISRFLMGAATSGLHSKIIEG